MKPKLIKPEEALKLNHKEIRALHKRYINPGLVNMFGLLNFDKKFVRAEGIYVWGEDGKRYMDFLGGYGSLNFGHNHPKINDFIHEVESFPNILQASLGTMNAVLAHNLAQLTPGRISRTFFCNSGAEAVEGSLKLARGASKKKRFIYCEQSFHGKSFGALSITGRNKYQEPFKPLLPGCVSVPYGDISALEEELKKGDVAAFITEPIQGEGGINIPPDGYLRQVRELTKKYDTLLIFDEIQTGFGRTGKIFACEYENVEPDIMCLGKSIGGGVMPLGAFTTTEDVWDKAYGGFERCLLHTSTFGGNTRAAAAGIASLQLLLDEDLAEKSRENGVYFLQRLQELQEKYPGIIKEVRGRGLFIGVEFNQMAGGFWDKLTGGALNKVSEEYMAAFVAAELINKYQIIAAYTLNNPNVIRLEPPLIVSKENIDQVVSALQDIFERNKSVWRLVLGSGKHIFSSLKR